MTAPMESSSRLNTWPIDAVLELEQLAGHRVRQAVDAGDAVADLDDRADLADLQPFWKPAISCFRTLVISATLIAITRPLF